MDPYRTHVGLSPSLQRTSLVLNRNWQPINVATVARALIMLWNDSAKIVDPIDYQLYDWWVVLDHGADHRDAEAVAEIALLDVVQVRDLLLAIGFGLGLLFGGFDVPAAGPAGIAVAILLGSGVCVLLLAALRRVFPASGPLRTNVVELSDDERLVRLAESRVRRAKLTVLFSAASTFMAFALFLVGIPAAFINFNFASGTNDIGLIMMFTGLVVGVIVIVGSLIGIPFGWIAGNASGNFTWFFAALSLPIIQAIACLVVTYIKR